MQLPPIDSVLCCVSSRRRRFPSYRAETKLSEAGRQGGGPGPAEDLPAWHRQALPGRHPDHIPDPDSGVCDIWKCLSNFKAQAVAWLFNPLQCSKYYLHCGLSTRLKRFTIVWLDWPRKSLSLFIKCLFNFYRLCFKVEIQLEWESS